MRLLLVFVLLFCAITSGAIDASNRYRSPRNPERRIRRSTELIVLHTTEAPARSSLNKVSERGECHFCVTEDGSVYRIVDRDRVAFHAGRSMWNGREDVDEYSIGIECVGYHNKAMPMRQLYAIRDLVKQLQSMYRIPDERVVAHSHVAYGAPNRWQKRRHRGRKRCGMLFAMPSVRRILALRSRPAYDKDTRTGRLSIGDDYLNGVLYGRTDTMVATYRNGGPAEPSGGNWLSRLFSRNKPATQVAKTNPKPKQPAKPVAKPAPKPAVKPAAKKPAKVASSSPPKSVAELKARGFTIRGTITKNQTARKIVGDKWNAADTYYTIRDKVFSGSGVNPAKLEKGMCVWRR